MPGFPSGHFYSPVIDASDLRRREGELFDRPPAEPIGVALDLPGQRELLEGMRALAQEYAYDVRDDEHEDDPTRYRDPNGMFEGLDSRMLFCMLRTYAPKRMVEVGSGFSSLLAADVNRRFMDGSIEITCIEPFPRDFLREGVPGIARLIQQRVELGGLDPFAALESGDVLFIDSSHVSKTGSDVNFLYLEVLPRLAEGVIIHVHDVFIPQEYPRHWVLEQERSWNEQYLLQALLMYSSGFEVLFGSNCATCFFPELVRSVFGSSFGGGSMWLRKAV